MTIMVNLNDKLVQHGLELSGSQNMEEILSEALSEYVGKRARKNLLDAMGTFDIDADCGLQTASDHERGSAA